MSAAEPVTTTTAQAAPVAAREHLRDLRRALDNMEADLGRLETWGRDLAAVLVGGGRLLVAGNGGSAAHAQHLSSELVGRYRAERRPLSAIALSTDTSALTALANDYGVDDMFARQVRAHGRQGDILVAFSTSGRSSNLLAAAAAAHQCGLAVWAVTGTAPNPLAEVGDRVLAVQAPTTATVQEVHQVAIHLLCAAVDAVLA